MNTSAVASLPSQAEQFFTAVLTDVKAWAGDIETVVVDDAKVGWLAIQPVLAAVGPSQWKILQGLVATVNQDLAEDDYAGIVQDVARQAATQELSWVASMPLALLTVIVAALKGSATA